MLFRKKSPVFEAWPVKDLVHAAEKDFNALPDPVSEACKKGGLIFGHDEIYIATPEGCMHAPIGDMLILGADGKFYGCNNIVFDTVYEAADGNLARSDWFACPSIPGIHPSLWDGYEVQVKLRNGLIGAWVTGNDANHYSWNGMAGPLDVIAYRIRKTTT